MDSSSSISVTELEFVDYLVIKNTHFKESTIAKTVTKCFIDLKWGDF